MKTSFVKEKKYVHLSASLNDRLNPSFMQPKLLIKELYNNALTIIHQIHAQTSPLSLS